MRHLANPRLAARKRSGKTLVLFVLLTPVLLGVTGLVIDTGMLLAAQRQAQNAADSAALAAAFDKFRGSSDSTALATANTFLTDNGLSGVTLTLNAGATNALNIPPQDPTNTGSTYKSNSKYVEVLLTKPVNTFFIQLLGVNSSQQVTARAVAGYEPVGAGQGAMVLNPYTSPGLDVSSNQGGSAFVRLLVNGDIIVNSFGGGVDQYGNTVAPNPNYVSSNNDAVKTQTGLSVPAIVCTTINVAGGVSDPTVIDTFDSSYTNDYNPNATTHPVLANLQTIAPDPLAGLATPTTSNGVVVNTSGYPQLPTGTTGTLTYTASSPQSIIVGNSNNYTLVPGVYTSIRVTGGTATFQPGIYVLGPGFTGGGNTLDINGGTVTVASGTSGISGVMFYNTGSNYDPTSGSPDNTDPNDPGMSSPPPKSVAGNFGGVNINGNLNGSAIVTLPPYTNSNNSSDPFNGMLFYQRRYNTSTASIGGNSANTNISGTLYAKWANLQLAGTGNFNAQFLVGSMSITGKATVTINATGKDLGKANLVFLVE